MNGGREKQTGGEEARELEIDAAHCDPSTWANMVQLYTENRVQ